MFCAGSEKHFSKYHLLKKHYPAVFSLRDNADYWVLQEPSVPILLFNQNFLLPLGVRL